MKAVEIQPGDRVIHPDVPVVGTLEGRPGAYSVRWDDGSRWESVELEELDRAY